MYTSIRFHTACGFLFTSKSGPEWNALRTTWGPNPLSSKYYVKQPLTIEDAKKSGFEQISTGCQGRVLPLALFRT